MSKFINNWRPEIRSLIKSLVAAGCQITGADNGEDEVKFNGKNMSKIVDCLTACDEAWLYVTTPTLRTKKRALFLVLGNDPGELVNDYSDDPAIKLATDAHCVLWEGKPQPKKLCPSFARRAKQVAYAAQKLNWMIDNLKGDQIRCGFDNIASQPITLVAGCRFFAGEGNSCGQLVPQLFYAGKDYPVHWMRNADDTRMFADSY